MPNILYSVIAIILGAFIGRFLAFTIHYLPKILLDDYKDKEPSNLLRMYFQKPFCWNCQKTISSLESLPIIGYFIQKGVCKQCQQPLGKRLLFLEITIALLFGVTLAFFPLSVPTLFVLFASCLLIAAFFTDFEHMILPDQFTLTLIWLGLIASLSPFFVSCNQAILGAVIGYGFFWFFNVLYSHFRGFDGMYPGDFKLNAGIGACVGVYWMIIIILVSLLSLIVVTVINHLLRTQKNDTSLLYHEAPYGCYSSIVTIGVLYLLLFKLMNPEISLYGF